MSISQVIVLNNKTTWVWACFCEWQVKILWQRPGMTFWELAYILVIFHWDLQWHLRRFLCCSFAAWISGCPWSFANRRIQMETIRDSFGDQLLLFCNT